MLNPGAQRYVDAHLRWRDATGSEKDRLLKEVLAARGGLKGREFKMAAEAIAAAAGRPTVEYTHGNGKTNEEIAMPLTPKPTETNMAEETTATATPTKKAPKAAKKPVKKAAKKKTQAAGDIMGDARANYEKSNVKTASGARSLSNGDNIAQALNGLTLEQLTKVAKRADVEERFAGWAKLNPGMQRMNLGNVLRAQVKAGDAKAKATVAEAAKMEREKFEPKKPAKKAKAA